jgi:unsaturated chondroitin disaccharide hydrolase
MTWAERTLAAMFEWVAATEAAVGTRWPLFADPETGEWTTTGRGSWAGGFWAGLLGLRAALGTDPADRAAARRRTAALASWTGVDTATRGLIFWYGTAFTDLGGLRAAAADALLTAYDPDLGVIPWGAAFGGPRDLARVDSLPGLVPLLGGAGPEGLRVMRRHLDRHVDLVTRGDQPIPAWKAVPDGGWLPHPDPPAGWSRTVPWLTLALADAAHAEVTHAAQARAQTHAKAACVQGVHLDAVEVDPFLLPRVRGIVNRLAAMPTGDDTSAIAIEAVALLKLADLAERLHYTDCAGSTGLAGGDGRLRSRAERMLRDLVADHVRDGRLLDGCYDRHRGVAIRHELVWGDFFLALGLSMITGAITPFAC